MRASSLLGALALIAAACKGKEAPKPGPGSDKPAPPEVDWARCDEALAKAPSLAATRRALSVIDGCQVCGDWAPLLRWNRAPTAPGAPKRLEIEHAMLACGYCDPNAKQRFLGTLDDARGTEGHAPWRWLGEICKDKVSAVPDVRFMSAPYYALDRIARAASARPQSAALLAAIDLPLPALAVSATGVELPASPVTTPAAGPVQITVMKNEIHVSRLPHAHLGAAGVSVVVEGELYPGPNVLPAALPAALDALSPDAAATITVVAPSQLPVARLVEIIAAAPARKLVLAVAAPGAPEGWIVPGTLPVTFATVADPAGTTWHLGADPDAEIRALKDKPATAFAHPPTIVADHEATIAGLVKLLGAIAFHDIHQATILAAP